MNSSLLHIRHVVVDLDGTIYCNSRLFGCTLSFLKQLSALQIGHTFVTNNTSRSKADYVLKLTGLGIPVAESQIYTSADSAIAYLRKRHSDVEQVAVLGTPSLCAQIEQSGFQVNWEHPQAVIVGFDTTLDYMRLCRAAFWIREGLPFIATHPDLVCPTDEPTVLIDCGAICACLTAATGSRPVVLGKPDPVILLTLCERLNLKPEEVAMVGDRLYTDIAMAQAAGVTSVLVLSGEATADQASAMPRPPDLVVANIGEFGNLLEGAHRAAKVSR